MAEDTRFGSDYSTFRPDGRPGLTYRRISGPRVPLEGVARQWLSAMGYDMPWAPNAGTTPALYQLLNSAHDQMMLRRMRDFYQRAAEQVDFVARALVTFSYVGTTLTITGAITLITGRTYQLNVGADAAGRIVAEFPNA